MKQLLFLCAFGTTLHTADLIVGQDHTNDCDQLKELIKKGYIQNEYHKTGMTLPDELKFTEDEHKLLKELFNETTESRNWPNQINDIHSKRSFLASIFPSVCPYSPTQLKKLFADVPSHPQTMNECYGTCYTEARKAGCGYEHCACGLLLAIGAGIFIPITLKYAATETLANISILALAEAEAGCLGFIAANKCAECTKDHDIKYSDPATWQQAGHRYAPLAMEE